MTEPEVIARCGTVDDEAVEIETSTYEIAIRQWCLGLAHTRSIDADPVELVAAADVFAMFVLAGIARDDDEEE